MNGQPPNQPRLPGNSRPCLVPSIRAESAGDGFCETKGHHGCYAGLWLTTFVTLTLEILLTRVLSVLTWYHLGFFAISVAMLGMTAGAPWVYFRPERFSEEHAPWQMWGYSLAFALAIPVTHVLTLQLRPDQSIAWSNLAEVPTFLIMTVVTATAFVPPGVIVAVALTKVRAPIGRLYAADLLGAAGGCVGSIALMNWLDPTSAMFLLGHPVHSLVCVLFSLILATGLGSLLSDRLFQGEGTRWYALPLVIAAIDATLATTIQSTIDATALAPFAVGIVVCACTMPLGLALGCCFPVGLRLVARRSHRALPWMWGIEDAWRRNVPEFPPRLPRPAVSMILCYQ